jgi:serine/threonine protein kinase
MIDESGTVKIIDFGATKVAGISEITLKNEGIVGTAQYTAPEYFLGQTGTHQSDIFSLGVLTYQMLSGELPYGNEIAKTRNIRSQLRLNYQPLSSNKNNIPGWVDYAIKKAVNINPEKRYLEVSEFIHEINYPNPRYMSQTKPPLKERNPVLVWQGSTLMLIGIIIYQNIS